MSKVYPAGISGTYSQPIVTFNNDGIAVNAMESSRYYCLDAGIVNNVTWTSASSPVSNPMFSNLITVPAYIPGTTLLIQPIIGYGNQLIAGTLLYGVLPNQSFNGYNGFYVVAQMPDGNPGANPPVSPKISFNSFYYAVFANPALIPGPFPAPFQVIEANNSMFTSGNIQTVTTQVTKIPAGSVIFTQLITENTTTATLSVSNGINNSSPPYTPGSPNFSVLGSGSGGNQFGYMIISPTAATLQGINSSSARIQFAVNAAFSNSSQSINVNLPAPLLSASSPVFLTPITSSTYVGNNLSTPPTPPTTMPSLINPTASITASGVAVTQINIQGLLNIAGFGCVGVTCI